MITNEAALRTCTKRVFTHAGREGKYFTPDTISSVLAQSEGTRSEHQLYQVADGPAFASRAG
jgi:hypothetical protein